MFKLSIVLQVHKVHRVVEDSMQFSEKLKFTSFNGLGTLTVVKSFLTYFVLKEFNQTIPRKLINWAV